MGKIVKKSRLAGVPAWALSVLTLVATVIYFSIRSNLIINRELAGQGSVFIGPVELAVVMDFTMFTITIPLAIFFICRTHPKSVWYTPVICNALGFGATIIEPLSEELELSYWIILGGSCLLSVTGAIIGARIGRRRMNQEK